jgi:ABC-type nitrate/sulfonate/bicarbonate transport system permease component
MARILRGAVQVLARVWLIVVLIVLWELASRGAKESYFPAPSVILPALQDLWFSGPVTHLFLSDQAFTDFAPSLGHLLTGWALAALVGVVLGTFLGRFRVAAEYLEPLLQFGRAVPPPTLIPFFLVVFKLQASMYILLIAFSVIWPVLLNTMDGVRTIDSVQLDTARVYAITGWQRLFHLILPAAAPKIFAGLRVSIGFAVILMVLSELVGTNSGIGAELINAQRGFEIPKMWAGIVFLGVLGYALNGAFLLAERRLLAWHRGARKQDS